MWGSAQGVRREKVALSSGCKSQLQPEATGAGMEVTKCGQIDAHIAGLILLAAAPCTAMVFGRPPRPPLARMV
jgi:hypothetical protein